MKPYYSDESVTLYHGDCREVTEWLAADVLVTDPPYGVRWRSPGTGATVLGDGDGVVRGEALDLWSAPRRPMAVFTNQAALLATTQDVGERRRKVRVATCWKANILGSSPGDPWLTDVEFVVFGVDTLPRQASSGVIRTKRFTGNPACNADPDAYLHPTQKPVPLMVAAIETLGPSGVVADPFAGSGSTLVAAKHLGRRAIGVELEERYCETAAKRLAQGVLDFGDTA